MTPWAPSVTPEGHLGHLQTDFIQRIRDLYPGLKDRPTEFYEQKVSENLFCPFTIKLPRRLKTELQNTITAFERLRSTLLMGPGGKNQGEFPNPGHPCIMNSFDFHLDSHGRLKLIEINTNASFLVLGHELYNLRGLKAPFEYGPSHLRQDITHELALWSQVKNRPAPKHPKVTIIDEKPEEQRLFMEFLVAQEWLRAEGFETHIRDVPDAMMDRPDFIYNRSTDFLLSQPSAAPLKASYLAGEVCLSPNPFEYLLMADKDRLIEWSKPGFLESLNLPKDVFDPVRSALLKAFDRSTLSADELWAQRKNLFFKPKREYGSKKAFRGASVSRKVFLDLMTADPIAQEYVPAPEVIFETPSGSQTFKYDLRCHAYDGRIQGLVARVYQGQVTNLRTEFGGFAAVAFE